MKINFDVAAFFFIVGSLSLLTLPKLIAGTLFYFLLILLCLMVAYYFFYKPLPWLFAVIFMLIGLLFSSQSAQRLHRQALPFVDKYLSVIATAQTINIAPPLSTALSKNIPSSYLIKFLITHIDGRQLTKALPIEVSWPKKDKPVYAGQCWKLCLISRAIHSRLNEGGFDTQRLSMSKGLLLRASVKDAQLLDNKHSFRQVIISNLMSKIYRLTHADMMIALLFGERQGVVKDKNIYLLRSGIAHIMAISGLHVILVAGFIQRSSQLCQYILPIRFISPFLPQLFSFIGVFFYVWLSGMNPPALRAVLIFATYFLLKNQGVEIGKAHLYLRLIALLILYDPLMVLSDSFWLSCLAALSLLFLYCWLPLPTRITKKWWGPLIQLLHLQLGIMLLLLPMQVTLFNGISAGGIVTNIVTLPLMSLLIMPLLIIGFVLFVFDLNSCAQICYFLSDWLLKAIMWLAQYTSRFWFTTSVRYYHLSFLGWLMVIIFRVRLWRYFYITVFLLLLFIIAPFFLIEKYKWRVDMLDVGHGLAMVIRQGREAIIYDTGQNYGLSSEAESQIIPFLQWHQLTPKEIILSHQHSDHIGGMSALKRTYPNVKLMSSSSQLPNDFKCERGNKWHWKKLKLQVLWPPRLVKKALNSNSCVISVSDGKFSLLLTGDLEKRQELKLMAGKDNIRSTILQMPHHGSNTSSCYSFLTIVAPQLAINSVSRYNPWRLPAKKVLSRYENLKIPAIATKERGQITLYFYKNHWTFSTFRQQIKPRWYHDWFGVVR